MSKRLQVILSDSEYANLVWIAKERKSSVSSLIRELLEMTKDLPQKELSPEKKLASLMRYAEYQGTTCDIDEMLEQIEIGRKCSDLH